MKILDTDAIILNTSDYGESDRLITFFARNGGKVKGIAKGARRSRKRFVHAFEPCSLVALTYREGRSLAWIEACKLLEPHLELRTEIERWGYAALIAELVMELMPEGQTQEDLFCLLKESMSRLSGERDALNVVLLFLIKFLDIAGYLPGLDECRICRRPLKPGTRWWWKVDEGTLLCSEHGSANEPDLLLDVGTLMLIRDARRFPLDRMWRLHIRRDRKQPLLQSLAGWARGQIRKDLKSMRLLRQVRSA